MLNNTNENPPLTRTDFRLSMLFKKEPAKTEDYSNSLPQCGQRHQKYSKMQNITKKLISIDTPNPVVVKNL